MNAYAVLWTSPLISADPENFYKQRGLEKDINIFFHHTDRVFKMYELSYYSFKKNYNNGQIKIITDSFGAFLFKKYTKILKKDILIELDNIDTKYNQLWNFGKMLSYRMIAKLGDPFMFFDLDLILNEAISNQFLNSKLFAYSYVDKFFLDLWKIDQFKSHLKSKPQISNNLKLLKLLDFEKDISQDKIYETSIPYSCLIGGSETKFYYECFEDVINNVLNIDNQEYWLAQDGDLSSRPSISEQFILGLYAHYKNLKFNFLPRKKIDIIHIGGDKFKLLNGYPYK